MTKQDKGSGGRDGLGDDQGTRVGSPTPGSTGKASGGRVSEELGGSGREGSSGSGKVEPGRGGKPTGAGAEAAEGVHSSEERSPDDRSGLDEVETGRGRFDEATVQRAGSEPITREREHKSGYGGDGGSPKQSSDKREPRDPEGKAR